MITEFNDELLFKIHLIRYKKKNKSRIQIIYYLYDVMQLILTLLARATQGPYYPTQQTVPNTTTAVRRCLPLGRTISRNVPTQTCSLPLQRNARCSRLSSVTKDQNHRPHVSVKPKTLKTYPNNASHTKKPPTGKLWIPIKNLIIFFIQISCVCRKDTVFLFFFNRTCMLFIRMRR